MRHATQNIDIESIPGTVVLADAGGVIEHVNRPCIEATGFGFDELVGNPLLDFWESPSESLAGILDHLQQQPVWRSLIHHKKKDGSSFQEISAISKVPADNEKGFFLLKVGQPVDFSYFQQETTSGQSAPSSHREATAGKQDDFRAILDSAPYAIAVNRMSDQRYVFFNNAFCRYTDYSPEELSGKTPRDLNLFHDPIDWDRMCEAGRSKENLDGFEATFRRRDFRLAHSLLSVRPIHYCGESCILYISQDLEAVQTVQENLRQSLENYRTIIEGAPVSIAITRLSDSVYQEVNDSFCRRVHYRREEILGRTPPDLNFYTNLEDRERFLKLFAEQGYVDDLEIRFQDKFGKTLESLVSARRLRYKGEDCLLYISTRIDNLKATQRALAEREENYRTILELAPYNISVTRRSDGTYLQVNKSFLLRTGFAPEEILGHKAVDLNFYANADDRKRLIAILERDGRVDSLEISFRMKDGRTVASLISMRPIHYQNEDCIISMTVDISELKAAQRALEESEARFRTIFETAADPIFLNDMSTGRFMDVNHAACRHLGYDRSEFLEMSLGDIHPSGTVAPMSWFSDDPEQNRGLFFESQHVRKDGSIATVEVSSQQMMHRDRRVFLSIVRDVTERKQIEDELTRYRKSLEQMVAERTEELKAAQRELVKREKMAVLGQIAATVSHELRNPLGVIRYSNFFLSRKIECVDDKVEKHFQRIDEQISLCDAIVADLLEYTEGRHVTKVHEDMADWLSEVVETQRQQKALDFHLHIARDLPKVPFDREKMQRVIINLLTNAAQAVDDRAKESSRLGVSYSPAVRVDVRPSGDGLIVEIHDNGIGMDQNALERAFEPLFTTRARGTGIGLAIVKKIVEEHDGCILLKSHPGEGTTVCIELPLRPSG